MAYYDKIYKQWDKITGGEGGALKQLILNEIMLQKISNTDAEVVLEIGAGNGYFVNYLHKNRALGLVEKYLVTDQSEKLLALAKNKFAIPQAEYQILDVCSGLPFDNNKIDLIIANMLFNELNNTCLNQLLAQSHRVLVEGGKILGTFVHPSFVNSLAKRKLLKRHGLTTMPGSGGLRLPVVVRSEEKYAKLFRNNGFDIEFQHVQTTAQLLKEKPGLKNVGKTPIAMIFDAKSIS